MDPTAMLFTGFPAPPPQQTYQNSTYQTYQTFRHAARRPPSSRGRDDVSDSDPSSQRVAHTLTACCRCRQRKTRCDPSLPRCLPCERSGSICEYYDTTKRKKISRQYVIKLQDRVRQLEAELRALTEEEGDFSHGRDELVRRGGLVRLSVGDDSQRYLGPSSGIAMSRLLMEEAKLFTDSKRISELIPEVRARREARMQSVVMTRPAPRRKSTYPMFSEHPAVTLPSRPLVDRLIEVFCQRALIFWPVIHEKQFAKDLEDVYGGSDDPYKNYVVRMVIAISLHKLDPQYAGLADSYYLAAMQLFEDVIRPRDLRSLQCLILIGQYSLLAPARMAVYFVIGLATRISQAMGLCFEKTITTAYDQGLEDALVLDMRRRLSWIVTSMEFGLSHTTGRPNGFAQSHDGVDVGFFSTAEDENITEEGILQGPESERKVVAIYFFKMRLIQSQIRRVLYEPSATGPTDDTHPWFASMEQKIQEWLDDSPANPSWCKPWFSGRFCQLRIFLYRPSPQVTQPSARAAEICYESASYIINLSKQQMEKGAVDVTWVFLLNLYMSLNIILWTVSYANIRQSHSREDVEELVDVTLDILEQCTDRWPGTEAAANLYSVLSRACLQVYDSKADAPELSLNSFGTQQNTFNDTATPPSSTDTGAPDPAGRQQQGFNPPLQFNYVFNEAPGTMDPGFSFANSPFSQQQQGVPTGDGPPPHPTFRSNSIFFNPSSSEGGGRRFSHFAPDFSNEGADEATPPATTTPISSAETPPDNMGGASLPTPPESMMDPSSRVSPPGLAPMSTPVLGGQQSPASSSMMGTPMTVNLASPASQVSTPQKMTQHMQPPPRSPGFPAQQQPLPQTDGPPNWFAPQPFISPFSFDPMSAPYFSDIATAGHGQGFMSPTSAGPGGPQHQHQHQHAHSQQQQQQQHPALMSPFGNQFMMHHNPQRQGSLSAEQCTELMQALESDGMGEIDAILSMGAGQGNVASWGS